MKPRIWEPAAMPAFPEPEPEPEGMELAPPRELIIPKLGDQFTSRQTLAVQQLTRVQVDDSGIWYFEVTTPAFEVTTPAGKFWLTLTADGWQEAPHFEPSP